jgi:hypothetical protein
MALNAGKIKISVYRNGCSTHTLLVADRRFVATRFLRKAKARLAEAEDL